MSFGVKVVTPHGEALSAEAEEITLPGILGELGVLSGHRPLISGLKPGVLRLRTGKGSRQVAVGAGFLQVTDDVVSVLTEACETAETVDARQAESDLQAADMKLRNWDRETGSEFERLQLDRLWAEARVRVAKANAS